MPSIKAGLIPAGTFVLRFLPRRPALVLASLLSDLCFLLLAGKRTAIEQNLIRTAPGTDARGRRRLARSTFRHFAGVWVDFLRFPLMTRQALLDLVHWNTRQNLDAALAQGKGALMVTPHVGALDLAGLHLAGLGYQISVVVEDIDPSLYRVFRRYRATTGMRVISRRHGAVAAYRALRRGEIVVLVADRLIGGPGLEVDFCGDRRLVPVGPAALARRTGAPLIVSSLVRRRDGTGYDAVTEPAMLPSGTTEELTQEIAMRLSRIIQGVPDQWFEFQAGWLGETSRRTVPMPIHQLLDSDA